jgi:hypothetical protein
MQQAIAVTLPILLTLILLPPLAFASPPDPSWVAGFFDGADGDDVVSLVYETSAANQTSQPHLGPLPCLLEMYLDSIVRNVPGRHFTRGPRSPPILRSPEFVSVFNSLPPPALRTEVPACLRLATSQHFACQRLISSPLMLRPIGCIHDEEAAQSRCEPLNTHLLVMGQQA